MMKRLTISILLLAFVTFAGYAIDNSHFKDIIWESPTDEIEGKDQFVKIDEENLDYDFHLSEQSTAKGKGCY